MRIAVDITPLKTSHKYRGIGFYTKNLIWALKEYKPEHKYIFFTRSKNLPKNADLVHYPYFDLFDCTLPLLKKGPTVVTIHDLIPLVFPNKFPRGIKGEIKWQVQRLSLKSVSAIITDSKNSKRDIVKFTHFPKERIYVIPLAPGREFRKFKIQNSKFKIIRRRYSLPKQFILYVGDVNWNKNVLGMLKAFHKLKTQNSKLKAAAKNSKLILVGRAFLSEELKEVQEINSLIDKLQIKDHVLKLGFVPTQDLVAIYNLATVYCQPSFYEGFGLPPLEAMTCGTPVVAANIPSLREVCGKVAVYVNPSSPEDIAFGILTILRLNALSYLNLVNRGLKWVEKFSWQKVAQKTTEVYKEVSVSLKRLLKRGAR